MKNLKQIARQTKQVKARDRNTWVPLYYNIEDDEVYSEAGSGRYLVTYLINENTEHDIKNIIEQWKMS